MQIVYDKRSLRLNKQNGKCPSCHRHTNTDNFDDYRDNRNLNDIFIDEVSVPKPDDFKSQSESPPVKLSQICINSKSRKSTKADIMNVLAVEGRINRWLLLAASTKYDVKILA